MSLRLSGINPLAYMGVEPITPPALVVENRAPTVQDYNYNIGTFWIWGPQNSLWFLAQLVGYSATWIKMDTSLGTILFFPTNSGIASPNNGVLNVYGGSNINTAVSSANTVVVNVNNSILLPATTSDANNGVIALGTSLVSNYFLQNYGTFNTFLGNLAGNLTLTVANAIYNTAVGYGAQQLLTTGNANSAFGAKTLQSNLTGDGNTAVGFQALFSNIDGNFNTCIGYNACSDYNNGSNSNICIGHTGGGTEINTLRIGTRGTSSFQQNKCYIEPIFGASINTSSTPSLVMIDGTSLLGSVPLTGTGFLRSAAGVVTTFPDSSTNGAILIASSSGAPAWSTITAGSNVTISNAANHITISATGGGGGGTTNFNTDTTPATESGGAITIAGGSNINTSGTGATVTINLNNSPSVSGSVTAGTGLIATTGGVTATAGGLTVTAGTITFTPLGIGVVQSSSTGVLSSSNASANGQLLIGKAGGLAPVWANLTSTGGSVTITNGAGTINLEASGVAALTVLDGDTGAATPVAGAVKVSGSGTTNILTSGSGNVLTVALINSPSVIGTLTVGTGLTVTSGATTLTPLGLGAVLASSSGVLSSTNGTNGQLLIAGTSIAPAWASLTSTGGTVVITTGPNSINLEAVGGGGGGGASVFVTSSGVATASGNTIAFLSGQNTNTDGGSYIVHTNLNTSIVQPVTNASGTQGLYSLGTALNNNPFMHAYGTDNTFLGQSAGGTSLPFTMTGTDNTGIGYRALRGATSGSPAVSGSFNTAVGADSMFNPTSAFDNTGVGRQTLFAITTGSQNVAVGKNAIAGLTSGTNNVGVGASSLLVATTAANNVGVGYNTLSSLTNGGSNVAIGPNALASTTTGSNNIFIGAGNNTAATTSNVINIGVQGTQTRAVVAGIYGATRAATDRLVFSDSTGGLATGASAMGDGVLISSATGVVNASNGTNGQVLIGGGTVPIWVNITAGTNITITNAANSITINSTTSNPASTCAFLAVQTTAFPSATGDGTTFSIGSGLTELFDLGSNLSGGTFTAPVTGYYYLEFSVAMYNLSTVPLTSCSELKQIINVNGTIYDNYNAAIAGSGSTGWLAGKDQQAFVFSIFVNMASGNTATFSISLLGTTPSKTAGIGPGVTAITNGTFISGYRVA